MRPKLVIDLRCLQDRNYAERGIGRHARCLGVRAPEPFIGIYDPKLPELPGDVAQAAAELSPHGYLPGLAAGTVFLNPSPMTPDQNFCARLLLDPLLVKAACVHDFIPYDRPETYLTHPVNRLDYFAALAWLKRYDMYLPNSAATAARLRELYGLVPVMVTGVALPEWVGAQPAAPRHILMVGGDDARKNPEMLAAAHAASAMLAKIPLVISGSCTSEMAARLRGITEVELPGKLSDAQLRDYYARAVCVVIPSCAEGFSLPVIEACAMGVPVIASDIAAHRELLPAPEHRFGVADAEALTRMLEKIVIDPEYRAGIVAAQSGLWQDYTPENVAARVFGALRCPAPAAMRKARPHIALLTPMPPQQSGIADYSASAVAALRALAEVTVFSGAEISALPHALPRFDRVVSVIGNSPLHARIYDLAVRWGSAVVCHDSRLLGLATRQGLGPAAELASRELRRAVDEDEILRWAEDENLREASFLGELAAAARPLIFHARKNLEFLRARFGVAAHYLPFAVQRAVGRSTAARAAAREALGFVPDMQYIVSFGFVTRGKGIAEVLLAFSKIAGKGNRLLVFAGAADEHGAGFARLAAKLGIAARVRFETGFLDEIRYRQFLLAADCGLQLRASGRGNISGALADCIAAGLPTVANADLAENLDAPAYVRRVGDRLDAGEIAAAIETALAGAGDIAAERAAYCAAHGMARYAERLLEILEV